MLSFWDNSSPDVLFDTEYPGDLQLSDFLWISRMLRMTMWDNTVCTLVPEPHEMLVIACSKGKVYIDSNGIQGNLFHGQAFFLPAAAGQCRLTAFEQGECMILLLTGSLPEQILEQHIREERLFCPSGYAVVQGTAAMTHQETEPEQISLRAYELLMQLHRTAERYEETSGYPPLVDAAIGILQNEFAQLYGIEEVADRLGISIGHLTRQFSRTVGISPGKYLKQCRIACAKQLLIQQELPVSVVSTLCGFSDANYFTKVFRKETGVSPGQYRQKHQAEAVTIPSIQEMIGEMYL